MEKASLSWTVLANLGCKGLILTDNLNDFVADNKRTVLDVRYEGCYRDGFQSDFERMIPMKRELLGVKTCTDECHLKGYPFAAIQNAQFCMCSRKYGRYGLADDESECRRVCLAGSPDEKCGGPWKNAVYKIGMFCGTYPRYLCVITQGYLNYGQTITVISKLKLTADNNNSFLADKQISCI